MRFDPATQGGNRGHTCLYWAEALPEKPNFKRTISIKSLVNLNDFEFQVLILLVLYKCFFKLFIFPVKVFSSPADKRYRDNFNRPCKSYKSGGELHV